MGVGGIGKGKGNKGKGYGNKGKGSITLDNIYKGSKGYGGYSKGKRKTYNITTHSSHSTKVRRRERQKASKQQPYVTNVAILDTTPGTAEYQCITWKMQQRHHTTQQQHGMNNITHMMHNGGTATYNHSNS